MTEDAPKIATPTAVRDLMRTMPPEALLNAAQIEAIVGTPKGGNIHQLLHRLASIGMLTCNRDQRPLRYGPGRIPSWEQDADERQLKVREANRISNLRYRERKRIENGRDALPPPPPKPAPAPRVVAATARVTATHTDAPKAPVVAPVRPETIEEWQARTGQRPQVLQGPGDGQVAYGRRPSVPIY